MMAIDMPVPKFDGKYDPEFASEIIPGATGPIPQRLRPTDAPICVGIPAVKVKGKLHSRNMIAKGTGIGISHISKIFKGTRRPSMPNCVKLAAYFGVTIEELLTNILPQKRMRLK